jgi:hypothetical protein
MSIFESIGITAVKEIYSNRKEILALFKDTEFLIYNPKQLIEFYKNEKTIFKNIPYSELIAWFGYTYEEYIKVINSIKIIFKKNEFHLSNRPSCLEKLHVNAEKTFKKNKKMTDDSDAVRLSDININVKETTLYLQKAKYSQQVQSNLIRVC